MTGTGQLLGACQTRGTRTNDGDFFAAQMLGGTRFNQTFRETAIDDGPFDRFDVHRRGGNPQRTGAFAGRGAEPAREFREVIRGVQIVEGIFPAPVVDMVVELGDEIVHRAAGIAVAEGDAAIHAARALVARGLFGKRVFEFFVVLDPLGDRFALHVSAVEFFETRDFSHLKNLARTVPPPRSHSRNRLICIRF